MPIGEVAARSGLTKKQVEYRLRCDGLWVKPPSAAQLIRPKVCSLYEGGMSIRAVAAEVGTDPRTVWRHLAQAGVARRPRGTPAVVLSRPALERLYVREGLSLTEVGRRFEVSADVVARNLELHGIPRRDPAVPIDRALLERLYCTQRLGLRAIAAQLGVPERKLRRDFAHHGVPIRQPGRPAQCPQG